MNKRTSEHRAPWAFEEPRRVIDHKLMVSYYEKQGILQFGFLNTNEQGDRKMGQRRISLRRSRLDPEAARLLRDVFQEWLDKQEEETSTG